MGMTPAVNALNDNLARYTRVRDTRVANSMDIHRAPDRALGGPAADPAWDAFFGGLQEVEAGANAAGLGFRTNFLPGGKSAPAPPSIAGLRKAIR